MASSMELHTEKKNEMKKKTDERPGGDSIREQAKQLTNNRCNMRIVNCIYEQNAETSIFISQLHAVQGCLSVEHCLTIWRSIPDAVKICKDVESVRLGQRACWIQILPVCGHTSAFVVVCTLALLSVRSTNFERPERKPIRAFGLSASPPRCPVILEYPPLW